MLATQVQYWQYKEAQRHNIATESLTDFQNRENKRHNLESERQGRVSITEAIRHNKATESISRNTLKETKRHNLATEKETNRHNVATEGISYANIQLGYANLAESVRHNKETEKVQNITAKTSAIKSIFEVQNLQADKNLKYAQAAKTEQDRLKAEAETELTRKKSKYYEIEAGAEAFSDISKGVYNLSKARETNEKYKQVARENAQITNWFN